MATEVSDSATGVGHGESAAASTLPAIPEDTMMHASDPRANAHADADHHEDIHDANHLSLVPWQAEETIITPLSEPYLRKVEMVLTTTPAHGGFPLLERTALRPAIRHSRHPLADPDDRWGNWSHARTASPEVASPTASVLAPNAPQAPPPPEPEPELEVKPEIEVEPIEEEEALESPELLANDVVDLVGKDGDDDDDVEQAPANGDEREEEEDANATTVSLSEDEGEEDIGAPDSFSLQLGGLQSARSQISKAISDLQHVRYSFSAKAAREEDLDQEEEEEGDESEVVLADKLRIGSRPLGGGRPRPKLAPAPPKPLPTLKTAEEAQARTASALEAMQTIGLADASMLNKFAKLMHAQQEPPQRIKALNVLLRTRNQGIVKAFLASKGLLILKAWLIECRERETLNVPLLSALLRVVDFLPMDIEGLRLTGLGKVVKFFLKLDFLPREQVDHATRIIRRWTQLVQGGAGTGAPEAVGSGDRRRAPATTVAAPRRGEAPVAGIRPRLSTSTPSHTAPPQAPLAALPRIKKITTIAPATAADHPTDAPTSVVTAHGATTPTDKAAPTAATHVSAYSATPAIPSAAAPPAPGRSYRREGGEDMGSLKRPEPERDPDSGGGAPPTKKRKSVRFRPDHMLVQVKFIESLEESRELARMAKIAFDTEDSSSSSSNSSGDAESPGSSSSSSSAPWQSGEQGNGHGHLDRTEGHYISKRREAPAPVPAPPTERAWSPPPALAFVAGPAERPPIASREVQVQEEREQSVLSVQYFSADEIPPCPSEQDVDTGAGAVGTVPKSIPMYPIPAPAPVPAEPAPAPASASMPGGPAGAPDFGNVDLHSLIFSLSGTGALTNPASASAQPPAPSHGFAASPFAPAFPATTTPPGGYGGPPYPQGLLYMPTSYSAQSYGHQAQQAPPPQPQQQQPMLSYPSQVPMPSYSSVGPSYPRPMSAYPHNQSQGAAPSYASAAVPQTMSHGYGGPTYTPLPAQPAAQGGGWGTPHHPYPQHQQQQQPKNQHPHPPSSRGRAGWPNPRGAFRGTGAGIPKMRKHY